MIIIQLRRILIHNLLSNLQRILPVRLRHLILITLQLLLRLRRLIFSEQILDIAFARRSLVDGEAGGEFLVCAYLDAVEEVGGEVLAVVTDQVVGCSLLAHVVDCHSAYGMVRARFALGRGRGYGLPAFRSAWSLNLVLPTSKICQSSALNSSLMYMMSRLPSCQMLSTFAFTNTDLDTHHPQLMNIITDNYGLHRNESKA